MYCISEYENNKLKADLEIVIPGSKIMNVLSSFVKFISKIFSKKPLILSLLLYSNSIIDNDKMQ